MMGRSLDGPGEDVLLLHFQSHTLIWELVLEVLVTLNNGRQKYWAVDEEIAVMVIVLNLLLNV